MIEELALEVLALYDQCLFLPGEVAQVMRHHLFQTCLDHYCTALSQLQQVMRVSDHDDHDCWISRVVLNLASKLVATLFICWLQVCHPVISRESLARIMQPPCRLYTAPTRSHAAPALPCCNAAPTLSPHHSNTAATRQQHSCNKALTPRQWPEVYDFTHYFARCASQTTHCHARIARETFRVLF